MKKSKTMLIVSAMTFAMLTGCAQSQATETMTVGAEVSESVQQEEQSGKKILIAYFTRAENIGGVPTVDATSSASIHIQGTEAVGNLKIMADEIAAVTGAEEFSILTAESYPEGYRDTTNLAKQEQNEQARPELASHVEDMSQYDIIFLGYPNWWGGLPMAVMTFLEEYDFAGKTIIPFASHGGSDLGSGPSEIAAICPDAILLDGFAVSHSAVESSQTDVENWVNDLLPQLMNGNN